MQLDHDQLRELLTFLGESDIQELRLEGEDFRLVVRRNLPAAAPTPRLARPGHPEESWCRFGSRCWKSSRRFKSLGIVRLATDTLLDQAQGHRRRARVRSKSGHP
jgi:hypothetical protein